MINVLVSVDDNYLDKAISMLFSLKKNSNEHIELYFVNHSLSKSSERRIKKFSEKQDIGFNILNDIRIELEKFPIGKFHFTEEMFYRIFAQFYLPNDVDRILWLDADIIIRKSISEFYHQSFENNLLIACPDIKYQTNEVQRMKTNLGLPLEHIYFNSGVLLLNIEKLRQETQIENIYNLCIEIADRVVYPDQDMLNYIYQKGVKYCNQYVYNFQTLSEEENKKVNIDEVCIVHYTSANKPWKYKCINSMSKYYWYIQCCRGRIAQTAWEYTKYFVYKVIRKIYFKLRGWK